MQKDFGEFMAIINSQAFRDAATDAAESECLRLAGEGHEVTDAARVLAMANERCVSMLQLYHEWVNS